MKIVLKWGLYILLALIASMCLLVFWLAKTESGLNWLVHRLPQVNEVRGLTGDLSAFSFEVLHLDLGTGHVTVRNGKLQWEPTALRHRQILIGTIEATEVAIALQPVQQKTPFKPWQGISIPATIQVQHAHIQNLTLRDIQSSQSGLEIDGIKAQVQVENNQLRLAKLEIDGLMGNAKNQVDITGTVDLRARSRGPVDLQTQLQWQLGEHQLRTHGRLHGQWQKLALSQTVTSPLQTTISGQIEDLLSTAIRWESQLQSQSIPGQSLLGKPVALQPGKLNFEGSFQPDKGLAGLTATLRGSALGGNEMLSFWALDADLAYAQDQLTVQHLKLKQQGNESPMTAQVSGSVSQLSQGMQNSIVALQGNIEDATWPLLEASPILTANANFKLTGRYGEYALLTNARGDLQSRPMQADLNVLLGIDRIRVNQARFSSGQTIAEVEGELGQTLALNWRLTAPDLNDVFPQLHGQIISQGKVSGNQQSPIIDASLDAQALSLGDLAIGSLNAEAQASPYDPNAPLQIMLDLGGLQSNGQMLAQQLTISVVGTSARHTMDLDGTLTPNRDLSINGTGGFNASTWSGRFNTVQLTDPRLRDWQLQAPMVVTLDQSQVSVSNTCFVNGGQSVCGAFSRSPASTNANAELRDLQLANLNRFIMLYDLRASGVANGELQLTQRGAGTTAQISGQLRSDNAIISWETLNDEQLETESLAFESITLSVEQQTSLSVRADIELENSDGGHLKLDVARPFGSSDFESAPIEGSTTLTIADLSVMPPSLLNDINLNGQLGVDAIIAGTLAEPTIDVTADIDDAVARVHQLGLNLKNINLKARSDGSPQIRLTGGMQSGEGQLDFDGVIDVQQLKQPTIKLTLRGQDLQLANTNDLLAVGDVNIQTQISSALVDVSGDILISQAELDFKVPESAVLASDDVILEGEDSLRTRSKQRLDLVIDLGPKTHFQAQGLDATLAGKLRVYQRPNGIVRGEGQINLRNGRYQAYGQDLAIDQGKLVFTGGSIDDPTLDIRAQKTVNDMTAGVAVSGRARSPRLNLYSTPTMPDQDILSVLIFDKPVTSLGSQDGITLLRIANSLRGDGQSQSMIEKTTDKIQQTLGLTDLALDVNGNSPTIQAGKQLSSKFYVGYGYGLLDATQSLILKYQLNDAWSIKADVGADSGADLRYQIER
ncbi:translocation/assembly module TamB [Arenicella chitinivorans]|uniref:Translocation/assembly module TamB n=1 Tax=Arenicella chitinivorans TaxID=1329800 RepID=A0A918RW00_9GAMM|nr:translocation/assembly module TamB domain-containing protein [Arenicella chitinivorans]GHA13306.1 translocation/assembly module TamB [Arenicella chitinivorans]